jgi:hypothetical protein
MTGGVYTEKIDKERKEEKRRKISRTIRSFVQKKLW